MSAFGIQVGWLAVRVTVVALLTRLFMLWTGKQAGRSNVVVLATALAMLLALTAAAVCPLPDCWRRAPIDSGISEVDSTPDAVNAAAPATPPDESQASGITFSTMLLWLHNLSRQTPESSGWQGFWAMLAILYVIGVSAFAIRLLAGWLALRRLRRRSKPITDPELLALADDLLRALHGSCRPELRECDEPGLAATIGWRRPAIFLPPEWRSWTADERRAVLAHELAHVRHRDYLIGLFSGLCQVLHFYHPLVRRLTAHLRWQQEVAADALAVETAGSRDSYLKSLARLALCAPARTPAGAIGWSALTGPTLLRRIHMLRGTEKRRPLGRIGHAGIFIVLAGTAVLLATLGGSTAVPAAENTPAPEPYELGYLSANAKGFVACRPAVWFKQPGMEKASAMLDQGLAVLKQVGITWPKDLRPEHIDQVVGDLRIESKGTGKPGSRSLMLGASTMLIRMDRDFDWLACAKTLHGEVKRLLVSQDKTWSTKFEDIKKIQRDGVTIYRFGVVPMMGPVPVYMHFPDRRSIVLSFQPPKEGVDAFLKILGNVSTNRKRAWGSGLTHDAPFAVVLDNHTGHYTELHEKDLDAKDLKTLDTIAFATFAIELGDGKPVRLAVDAKSAAAAPMLRRAFDGYARLAMDKIHEEMAASGKQDDYDKFMIKLATELVQSRRVQRHGSHIEWQAFSAVRVRDLIELMSASVLPDGSKASDQMLRDIGKNASVEVKEAK